MIPQLGVVEGYFGRPWSFPERTHVATRSRALGYSFFHYAPKDDAFLRRRWRERHPRDVLAALVELASHCRRLGMRFGIGLSPYELYRDYSAGARAAYIEKLRSLNDVGADDLAILFDDTRGDVRDLAAREAQIVHDAMAVTRATRIFMCPTYYSDDRMLDATFGERPPGYLEDLGRRLDPRVAVYWTGEEICAREYSPGHLARVADALGRKPVLWDNYPVNDGPRMSRFLHLRGFTGRRSDIAAHIEGHAINPALQPRLTLIPAATLAASYRDGAQYCYMRAFREASLAMAGPGLCAMLEADLLSLQDLGLDRLQRDRERLRARYAALDDPIAREVVLWLDGAYTVDRWEPEPGSPSL
ncbi:MAG TPA: beta-N-acetylglucosaminidase domain-containing protein [Usitatibacter sp.]|nr:beta-N-acetylglucosaminidase domain-containing protein [Usitatibacter sp.]